MSSYAVTCCESFDRATSPEDAAIGFIRMLRHPQLSCVVVSVSRQDGMLHDVNVFIDEHTGEPYCETETIEENMQ